MHDKLEAVREPLLRVGIDTFHVDLDTNRFGTFTGTVTRPGTQLETAVAKALESARIGRCSIGIGSEGAFGPDPVVGLVGVGLELVALVDHRRLHPVVGRDASHHTNFASCMARDLTQARTFATRVGAPNHGLIAYVDERSIEIRDPATDLAELLAAHHVIRLESDMRAHRNPTRMAAIRRAALDLAEHLRIECNECGRFGASNLQPRPGLPCSACAEPTERVLVIDACCSWCDAPMPLPPRHGLDAADPGECPYCNP